MAILTSSLVVSSSVFATLMDTSSKPEATARCAIVGFCKDDGVSSCLSRSGNVWGMQQIVASRWALAKSFTSHCPLNASKNASASAAADVNMPCSTAHNKKGISAFFRSGASLHSSLRVQPPITSSKCNEHAGVCSHSSGDISAAVCDMHMPTPKAHLDARLFNPLLSLQCDKWRCMVR